MSVTVKNILPTSLDIPGDESIFAPGEEKTFAALTPELINAIRQHSLEVVGQEVKSSALVDVDGKVDILLPVPWLGPDRTFIDLNGIGLTHGIDFTVDVPTNTLHWLDTEIPLKVGDRFTVIGGNP